MSFGRNFSLRRTFQIRHTKNQIPRVPSKIGMIQMQIAAKNLFAKVLFLAVLTVTLGIGASAQSVADVDAVVQKAIDAKVIPAAGVAVVRDGKVVLAKGYGAADVDSATPANENTAFQIASVTKQFT